jgi:hypothetical protein
MNTDIKVNMILDRLSHIVARISATKAYKGGSLSKIGYC